MGRDIEGDEIRDSRRGERERGRNMSCHFLGIAEHQERLDRQSITASGKRGRQDRRKKGRDRKMRVSKNRLWKA